jgi:sec-independent protein translocase protein TatA
MLPNVGIEEIFLLLVLALLLFGPAKLPEMARQLGKGVRDFKSAISGLDEPVATLPTYADAPFEPYEPPVSDETH